MLRSFLLFIGFILFCSSATTQEQKKLKFKDRITVDGFVKYMNTNSFVKLDTIIGDNLIHNRIKIKAEFTTQLTAVIEMRNRIFYGEGTRLNPSLGEFLDIDQGQLDLSITSVNTSSFVVHSIFDRAYFKYLANKWELRIGRQRINWGVNLAWNPNDLFNAYSLIDFDYQERPGSDAIRFQYYMGDLSSVELAVQPGNGIDESILAGLWKFNKWKYDFQFLAGNYYSDLAIGSGWAGNIKNCGIKGEFTYFQPKQNLTDTSGAISTSATFDYSFKNGIYVNASILYNSSGKNSVTNQTNPFLTFATDLSAKNLMPSKLTYFTQLNGLFNPLFNYSFSAFYMQGYNVLLLMPSVNYTIRENWEIMLIGQSAFGKQTGQLNALGNGIFLRLMVSY